MTFRYNFLGLIFLLLDKPFERKRHYFCSQFVTMLLEKSDIWHSSKAIGLTRPMDLMIIENKELNLSSKLKATWVYGLFVIILIKLESHVPVLENIRYIYFVSNINYSSMNSFL